MITDIMTGFAILAVVCSLVVLLGIQMQISALTRKIGEILNRMKQG